MAIQSEAVNQYFKQFSEQHKAQLDSLSEEQMQFVNHVVIDNYNAYYVQYEVKIPPQRIDCLSNFVKGRFGAAVDLLVPTEFASDYYHMLDKFIQFQYDETYYRRSFRCSDYYEFIDRMYRLTYSYFLLRVLGCTPENTDVFVLKNYNEPLDAVRKNMCGYDAYIIAARIDAGDQRVINVIKEMITSENNAAVLTTEVIKGIICSSDEELHDLLCKLLIAAGLSEGLRQAICEAADGGTPQAFIKIMNVIREHNFVRFASVKRAIGTWTALCRWEDPDRLAGKIVDGIVYALESRENAIALVGADDPVDIYLGLWGLGFYNVEDALNVILDLTGVNGSQSGTMMQLLTVGYFCRNLNYGDVTAKAAVAVVEAFPEDYRLFSLYDNLYIFRHYDDKTASRVQRELHGDKALAAEHYNIMLNMYHIMPQKKVEFSPMLYPWYASYMSKSILLLCMLNAAIAAEDDGKVDFVSGKLGEIESGYRSSALEKIAERLTTQKQRDTVINAVADRDGYTRKKAVEALKKNGLFSCEYAVIEKFAKYKTADLREGIIELLKRRDASGLNESIMRMLPSKDENIRLASLDLLQYAIGQHRDFDYAEAKALAAAIPSPSEREEILLGEIIGGSSSAEVTKENGYGLYDPKATLTPVEFQPNPQTVRDYLSITPDEHEKIYLAFMKLIDDNAELEFKDASGEEHLLGTFSGTFIQPYWTYRSVDKATWYEKIPCHDLWAKFYCDTIQTKQRFWAVYIGRMDTRTGDIAKVTDDSIGRLMDGIFGSMPFSGVEKRLCEKDERFGNRYFWYVFRAALESIASEFHLTLPLEIIRQVIAYFAKEVSYDDLWLERANSPKDTWNGKKYNILRYSLPEFFIDQIRERMHEDFEVNFRLLHELALKNDPLGHLEKGDIHEHEVRHINPQIAYYVKACDDGIISEDILYKTLLESFGVREAVSRLAPFVSGRFNRYIAAERYAFYSVLGDEYKEQLDEGELPTDSEFFKFGNGIASKLIEKILDVELKRGDSETVFSKAVIRIGQIYGMDRLMEILKAFGSDTISRTSYWYGNTISKKQSLSHLLGVCYPAAGDNAKMLAEYMKKSKIKPDRLIEVAMYSPQWIDIVAEYLGIEGMKSGCYYFMAHTAAAISERTKAIIAKYTPLTKEELNGGCFDANWFREAYDILGEKTFDKLYKAAKYTSDNNMHTRARKFADAALGKMDIAATESTINEKRNKDLLLSLAIIPSKGKKDILQRYEFIQNFARESKQFGAQRRASEGAAAQFALKNLAVTAGYSDDTRLTLSMETQLVREHMDYFEPNDIGGYDVMIAVEDGKPALQFAKGGKALKSAPAAIKKDAAFVEMKAFCDKLRQQYSRTVKMFELAMEERSIFGLNELLMLCENPVIQSIVEKLVFVSAEGEFVSGMISGGKFTDEKGNYLAMNGENDKNMRVAHPFDLYEHKVWADWQQLFLERGEKEGIRQPFRQVFRELYVKLPEELDKEKSLMFAGNQIQTARTVGALKNRRWIADYEDGLQKVYYKDDIIAGIYAVADWFSPSDIEAPTLEGVFFVNRRTYEPIKLKDIPDIVYSEVMRDVDLAVSVAHAGGVDPETSHSTVEMRKVILEFNLKLFGVSNVTLDKNHAIIQGKHGRYSIHLGSGVIHKFGGHQINVLAVQSGKKSKLFLPFIDEDPKTAEIMTKVLTFAQDDKIKDPYIMHQIAD